MKARLNTKLDLKKNYCYLLAPAITGAVLILAFIIGRVYPFGSHSVAYFDMAQRFIPNYYHIWDAMHDTDIPLWFNWYTGFGVNDTADASFSLYWLVLAIIPRRLIGKSMSLYVVMFFSLSALSASVFLRRVENTKPFMTTMLSVCYAFCGYSVMYYTNTWQDTVFLLPLLMLAWVNLFKNGKCLAYIFLVFLNFQCNYYVFGLSLIYLFSASFIYLFFIEEKGERRAKAQRLGAATIIGILLSGFSLVPKLVQTISSGRFMEETGFDFSSLVKQYIDIARVQQCKYPEKITMLFLTALPIAIIVLGVFSKKSSKKENAFYLLNIALMAVPIFCEGTNLLMHLGDYKYFPMRTGYLLSFALIWAGGHYASKIKLGKTIYLEKEKLSIGAIIVNAIAFCGVFGFTALLLKALDMKLKAEFSIMWALPVLAIMYIAIILLSGKLLDYRASVGGLLAEIIIISTLFVPYWNTTHNKNEQNPAYIEQSQKISEALNIEGSITEKVKTIGTTLNCNYGTVIQRATIADWTHLIPSEVNSSLIALGYSGDFTRIHDSGGTAFTDALFGVTNVLSVKKECPALYDQIDKQKGYNYYSCKYTMPYGIVVDRAILDIDYTNGSWMDLNNKIYSVLSYDNEPIVTDANLKLKSKSGKKEIYTFTSTGNSVAYFRLRGASGVNIYVNGKKLTIPSVDKKKNKKYPVKFNQGLICLGSFKDGEEVEIKLALKKGKYEDKADFRKGDYDESDNKSSYFLAEVGLLNLDKLGYVCEQHRYQNNNIRINNYTLRASTLAEQNKVLLVPLQHNGCWRAWVTGGESELHSVMGVMSAVEIPEGYTTVHLQFEPTGFRVGMLLSGIGALLLWALLVLQNRKNKLLSATSKIVYALYTVAFCGGAILIYVIPLGIRVLHLIRIV